MALFRSKKFDPTKIQNLAGKVAVVTGGNSGIGYETARNLARASCTVYIVSRNETKAREAIARMGSELVHEGKEPSEIGKVEFIKCDLSSIKGTKAVALDILNRQGQDGRLDILVNNAALLAKPFELTEEGISDSAAANHFGPFVLTTTLLPLMEKTAAKTDSDVRIVNVASFVHKDAPKDLAFRTMSDFNNEYGTGNKYRYTRYAYSKLLNILFTRELQRQLDARQTPIITMAIDPGGVMTEGVRDYLGNLPLSQVMIPAIALVVSNPLQGSITSLFAATSPVLLQERTKYKGKYLVPPGKLAEPSAQAKNETLAKALWDTTEKVVNDVLSQ